VSEIEREGKRERREEGEKEKKLICILIIVRSILVTKR
jgi:hypothetical protein